MFQPFERFKPEYLQRLLRLNKTYLVSQTYHRAGDRFEDTKTSILFSDYDEKGLAQIHYSAVKKDRYASLIDLSRPAHQQKVTEMLRDDSAYKIYWAVVRSAAQLKQRVQLKYTAHIRRYVEKHTSWRIGAAETLRPSLQVVYGELFIVLKRGNQTLRVKFEEIENA